MLEKIKKTRVYILLSQVKQWAIKTFISDDKYCYKIIKWKFKHPKGVFLILTPTHENLGDHAIAVSEKNMLDRINIHFFEIETGRLKYLVSINRLNIMNGRAIIVNGGGNLGTLWFDVELLFRKIISSNPKSKILCFPNTFFYEDSKWGKEELKNSIEIYNSHRSLFLFAREESSYNKMKPIYKNVELAPDMVLAIDLPEVSKVRNGCLLCMRSDIEKTISKEQEEKLNIIIKKIYGDNISLADTVLDHGIPLHKREYELNNMWCKFQGAELVITDRLHGMIFAAITGTPCIVLNSKSPKVLGCYKWIKDYEYIKCCDDVSELENVISSIPTEYQRYSSEHLKSYFSDFEKRVVEIIGR